MLQPPPAPLQHLPRHIQDQYQLRQQADAKVCMLFPRLIAFFCFNSGASSSYWLLHRYCCSGTSRTSTNCASRPAPRPVFASSIETFQVNFTLLTFTMPMRALTPTVPARRNQAALVPATEWPSSRRHQHADLPAFNLITGITLACIPVAATDCASPLCALHLQVQVHAEGYSGHRGAGLSAAASGASGFSASGLSASGFGTPAGPLSFPPSGAATPTMPAPNRGGSPVANGGGVSLFAAAAAAAADAALAGTGVLQCPRIPVCQPHVSR